MNHEVCARWARWAPGAVHAWYEAHPGETRAERQEVKARRAGMPLASATPAERGVWAPFVRLPLGAWPQGVLVRVQAGRLIRGSTVPAPDPLVRQAWAWLCGLCGVSEQPVPAAVGYVDPPESLELDGQSPGLAVAVALLAFALERSPRGPVIASARVDGLAGSDPSVGAVDYTPQKRAVCSAEAPGIEAVIADRKLDVAPCLAAWFGPDWRSDLARVLGTSSWRLATDAWDAYRAGRHADAEPLAEAAIGMGGAERNLAYAWLVRGACRLHRGESAAALEDVREAERRLSQPHQPGEDPSDPWELEELSAHLGVALVDAGRPSEAIARLDLSLQRLLDASVHDKSWRLITLQVAGTLHRARLLAGDLAGARDALERVSLGEASFRKERARCLGDLAEVLRRTGDIEGARARLMEADAELAYADPGARARTAQFLQLYRARVGLVPAPTSVEPPDWRRWPQPAEVLEALRAGHGDLDAWMAEYGVPDATGKVVQTLVYLGAAARGPGPTPAWALTLAERLAEMPGVEPGIAELARRVGVDGLSEFATRSPY